MLGVLFGTGRRIMKGLVRAVRGHCKGYRGSLGWGFVPIIPRLLTDLAIRLVNQDYINCIVGNFEDLNYYFVYSINVLNLTVLINY